MEKPDRYKIRYDLLDDITIIIAAYNEEMTIYDTIKSICSQEYTRKVYIKVVDNNSIDRTKYKIYEAIEDFSNDQIVIEYLFEKIKGKFAALNKALKETFTRYVVTIDADTLLYDDALIEIVNNMYVRNQYEKVGAIAGTVLVKNGDKNIITKIQYLEYFLSIASIKRIQGLYQSVLVAQGAFSIYDTELLKKINGWKDSIGEDIVLTWMILLNGYKVYYSDCAIAFTNCPEGFIVFMKQRARWARGMIEGFRNFSFNGAKGFYKWFVFTDLFLFVIDFSVTFIYIPGLIAALIFQNYLIVGIYSLLILPITILMFGIMFLSEYYKVFKPLGLKCHKYFLSFIVFMLFYSLFLSPTCVYGYIQEFLGLKRIWK